MVDSKDNILTFSAGEMENIFVLLVTLIIKIYYLVNLIYAFLYGGLLVMILNLFIPYAILYDLIIEIGRIGH